MSARAKLLSAKRRTAVHAVEAITARYAETIAGSKLAVRYVPGGWWAVKREYLTRGDYRPPIEIERHLEKRTAEEAAQSWRECDRQALEEAAG